MTSAGALAPSCVIFDFDGVLVASNARKREAYFDIFRDFRPEGGPGLAPAVPITLAVAQGTSDPAGGDRFDVIARILRLAYPDVTDPDRHVSQLADHYNEICEVAQASGPERAGASALLRRWSGQFPLYVNSATPEVPLQRAVERRGWAPFFKGVFGRPTGKTANIARALAQESVPASRAVMIGDGRLDLAAATQTGCHFIAIESDGNDFPVALPMVRHLDELDRAVAALLTGDRTAKEGLAC
jgi:phosphoglycolate phosphatase